MNLKKCLIFSGGILFSSLAVLQAQPDGNAFDNHAVPAEERTEMLTGNVMTADLDAQNKENIHICSNGSRFIETQIEGFTLMVADSIYNKEYTSEMFRLLKSSFKEVNKYLLKEYTDVIKKSPIWFEQRNDMGVAAYHPSVEWLRAHGKNEEFAKCIQCANTKSGVLYVQNNQPYMFLHEMAHLIHHLVLGYENEEIIHAYENAMEKHLYDNVLLYSHGKFTVQKKAYCCNNYKEYFSELTESYFGINDFYPFTRSQLKEHDPVGFAMMESIWKQPRKYAAERQKEFIREKYDKR